LGRTEYEAGDGAVEKEIVPLDRGADGGRNDGAAQLPLVFDRGKLEGSDVGCSHGVSPAGRQAEMGAARRNDENNL